MRTFRLRWLLLAVALLCLFTTVPAPTPGLAQTDAGACSALVKQTVQDLTTNCGDLQTGNICYGHKGIEATLATDSQNALFDSPGDQAQVSLLKTVRTLPLDLTAAQLGTAAMSFSADPSISALMMGDVSLKFGSEMPTQPAGNPPAQALYFRAAFGDSVCDGAQAQLVIRSTGDKPVTLFINGANITFTALTSWRWQSANSISVTVHDGSLQVADGPKADAGQTLVAVVDNDGTVVLWSAARAANDKESRGLDSFSPLTGSLAAFVGGCVPGTVHVVKANENLFRISLRYKVSMNAIMAANGLTNPNLLLTGQRLKIPCGQTVVTASNKPVSPAQPANTPVKPAAPAPTAIPAVTMGAPCNVVHVVGPNENLFRIALRYHANIAAIMAANGMVDPQAVFVGQRLIIPCG